MAAAAEEAGGAVAVAVAVAVAASVGAGDGKGGMEAASDAPSAVITAAPEACVTVASPTSAPIASEDSQLSLPPALMLLLSFLFAVQVRDSQSVIS